MTRVDTVRVWRVPSALIRSRLLRFLGVLGFVALAIAALWSLPLLHLAPNRLLTGTPIHAGATLGALALPVTLLIVLAGLMLGLLQRKAAVIVASLLLVGSMLLLAAGLGIAATSLIGDQPPAARARLASGSFASMMVLGIGLLITVRLARARWLEWLAGLLLVGGAIAIAASGLFDALSVVVEYRARQELIASALFGHLGLSLGGLILAVFLTLALAPWTALQRVVDVVVNGIQVVPAVALFGALVAMMSAVLSVTPVLRAAGLGALGPAPAILGIAAYLMLPLWRGLDAAMRAPDQTTLDAARALGLSPAGIVRAVRLPIGAPVLVGAVRVAAVQSIGLATLGALVGAGGLGAIVFDGMAQFAPDLILLGAIPIVALSLAANVGIGLVEDHLRARLRGEEPRR